MSIEYFTKERIDSPVHVYGYNPNTNTTEEDTWDASQAWLPFAAAVQLDISSGSVNDVMTSGSGAWQVRIFGLDANYAPLAETINLNGQTAVVTAGYYLRVYGIEVIAAGTGKLNAGIIYAADAVVTQTVGVPSDLTKLAAWIEVGKNISHNGFWTAPAGKDYIVTSMVLTCRAQITQFNVYQKLYNGLWMTLYSYALANPQGLYIPFDRAIDVPAKSDLRIANISGVAGAIATCSVFLKPTI